MSCPGGRVLLGIGTSGPQVAEGWHGQRFARQLQRTREYVAVVRKALAREKLEFQGETLELPLARRPGQGAASDDLPRAGADPDLPGRDRPQEHRAGRRDRRWLDPDFFSPDHVGELRELLEEGAARARAARSTDFDIAPTVNAFVSDDVELARNVMRPVLALYIGGMGSREAELLQQARPALWIRGGAQRGPGSVPGRQEGRGRRRDPG